VFFPGLFYNPLAPFIKGDFYIHYLLIRIKKMKHPWPSVTKGDEISPLAVIPSGARNLQDFSRSLPWVKKDSSLRSEWQVRRGRNDNYKWKSKLSKPTKHAKNTNKVWFWICHKGLSRSFAYFAGYDKVRKTLGFVPQPNLTILGQPGTIRPRSFPRKNRKKLAFFFIFVLLSFLKKKQFPIVSLFKSRKSLMRK